MLQGIEAGKLRAGWVVGGDPVVMWADSRRTQSVLQSLDFLMVQDFFLTPTAQIADLVLPVATYLEYENLFFEGDGGIQYRPALAPGSDARSDMDIINEMGKRLGLADAFWPDMDGCWRGAESRWKSCAPPDGWRGRGPSGSLCPGDTGSADFPRPTERSILLFRGWRREACRSIGLSRRPMRHTPTAARTTSLPSSSTRRGGRCRDSVPGSPTRWPM